MGAGFPARMKDIGIIGVCIITVRAPRRATPFRKDQCAIFEHSHISSTYMCNW